MIEPTAYAHRLQVRESEEKSTTCKALKDDTNSHMRIARVTCEIPEFSGKFLLNIFASPDIFASRETIKPCGISIFLYNLL